MKKFFALTALSLACLASAAVNTYNGSWATVNKTNGPATVRVNTANGVVTGHITDNYSHLGYDISGTMTNRVFSGFLSSNGKKWACTGTGTYGVSRLDFQLRANGVPFRIVAAR